MNDQMRFAAFPTLLLLSNRTGQCTGYRMHLVIEKQARRSRWRKQTKVKKRFLSSHPAERFLATFAPGRTTAEREAHWTRAIANETVRGMKEEE